MWSDQVVEIDAVAREHERRRAVLFERVDQAVHTARGERRRGELAPARCVHDVAPVDTSERLTHAEPLGDETRSRVHAPGAQSHRNSAPLKGANRLDVARSYLTARTEQCAVDV